MKHRNRIPHYLDDFVGGTSQADNMLNESELANLLQKFCGVGLTNKKMSKRDKKALSLALRKTKEEETKKTIMAIAKKMNKNKKTEIKFL